jgi:hypothetical protein
MRFSSLRFELPLALAVLGVDADHPHHAAPMDNLALHTNFLDRCTNLHFPLLRLFRPSHAAEDAGLKPGTTFHSQPPPVGWLYL